MSTLYLLYVTYVIGVALEFHKTMKQLIFLEDIYGFITKELKLNKTELFISVIIISLGWIIVEPLMIIKSKRGEE